MGFLGEKGGIPGLYFQAQNDNPGGARPKREEPIEPTIPAETMTGLEFLSKEALVQIQKVADERGTEAAAAEARGLMDA